MKLIAELNQSGGNILVRQDENGKYFVSYFDDDFYGAKERQHSEHDTLASAMDSVAHMILGNIASDFYAE